jgi:hypothetical protein
LVQLAVQLAGGNDSAADEEDEGTEALAQDFSFVNGGVQGRGCTKEDNNNDLSGELSERPLLPSLIRLLDILVDLVQMGDRAARPPMMTTRTLSGIGARSGRLMTTTSNRSCSRAVFEGIGSSSTTTSLEAMEQQQQQKQQQQELLEGKVHDVEAVQVLHDVFLKSKNCVLQLDILDRLLRLFASHVDNYAVVQELRTIPLFLQNMGHYPFVLQERLLKILEYAVTVVNCVPEQELLSLCYLLQQPYASPLRGTVLSFFEKLLSFNRQYKKVFREVGVLDLLLDDLKHCELPGALTLLLQPQEDLATQDAAAAAAAAAEEEQQDLVSLPGELHIFDDTATVGLAWDCLLHLLRKMEGNQAVFRKANGVGAILPLLASSIHRVRVLRVLSCLICEDSNQV